MVSRWPTSGEETRVGGARSVTLNARVARMGYRIATGTNVSIVDTKAFDRTSTGRLKAPGLGSGRRSVL
jgi:hypothetical protein